MFSSSLEIKNSELKLWVNRIDSFSLYIIYDFKPIKPGHNMHHLSKPSQNTSIDVGLYLFLEEGGSVEENQFEAFSAFQFS